MSDEEPRVTFRYDQERKERFDQLLDIMHGMNLVDDDVNRSVILRQCLDEHIEEWESELEERGALHLIDEGNQRAVAAPMAD